MTGDLDRKVSEMKDKAWEVFIASIFKETQVGRSLYYSRKEGRQINKKEFRKMAFDSTKRLMKLIDAGTIKREDILREIKSVSNKTGASIGHSQKIINTCLKGYCLLLAKPTSIIEKLDCPLDSTTMSKSQRIKDIDIEDYQKWQSKFENEYKIRLLRDKEYDENRLYAFFNPKD